MQNDGDYRRGAFDHAVTGMAILSTPGRFLEANRAALGLLGYSANELAGTALEAMLEPEDLATHGDLLRRVMTGDVERCRLDLRLRHHRGHMVWVVLEAAVVPDAAGAPDYLVVQLHHVSERKNDELAARASDARYEHSIASAPGMVYQLAYHADGTRAFTVVSEGSRALLGLPPETILNDPNAMFGLVHPEDRADFHESGAAARAAFEPWSWEGRVVLHTGQVKRIQAASRLERQPDGSVLWHGVVMDVTERRQTAARLEESEQRYRSLFDQHPDAVYWLDTSGKFLSANTTCAVTTGYGLDELVGGSFIPLILPEFLEATAVHFDAAVAGVAQRYEVVICHKDGRHVPLDVTNVPVVVGGQVIGVLGIARDLTGQRALEEQLRHSQKMDAIGQLAGGVAHDFNNILAAITGFAQLLESDIEPDDPRSSDVQEILKGARRAATLTRHLLAFSRRQVLHPEPLDLGRVVGDTMAMLRPLMGGMLTLAAPAPPCIVPVLADRTQLEQVLMNLALNARDAMPDGGTLTIEVGVLREPGAEPLATLTVRDTGAGMTPDVAARAFEPFFTTKLRGEGTGLGLATVHGIVRQSGGSLTLDTQPGVGSTFTVRLPLADVRPSWPDADDEPVSPPRAATVLVVDDEESLRSMMRRVLERAGYRVLTAADGVAALDLLSIHAHAIDVLISDIAMPELGGIELAARATERLPGMPVILMSGYAPEEMVPGVETGNVAAFLHKPFMAAALLDVLERVVRGAAPRAPAG